MRSNHLLGAACLTLVTSLPTSLSQVLQTTLLWTRRGSFSGAPECQVAFWEEITSPSRRIEIMAVAPACRRALAGKGAWRSLRRTDSFCKGENSDRKAHGLDSGHGPQTSLRAGRPWPSRGVSAHWLFFRFEGLVPQCPPHTHTLCMTSDKGPRP